MVKKRGKSPISSSIKKLEESQDKVLFSLFFWKFSRKHMYAFSSLIFSIVIGLAIVRNIRKSGSEISIGVSYFIFALSIAIVFLIISKKISVKKNKNDTIPLINMLVIIYLTNLFFVGIFYVLFTVFYGIMMTLTELLFILGLTTIASTISLKLR